MIPDADQAPPRKTCKRYNIPGHAHFLTFSCLHRRPFLSRERPCTWLADAIHAAKQKHLFSLIAYVFMPEHVHLLIRPNQIEYNISVILQSIKAPVGRRARDFVLREAPNFLDQMTICSGGKSKFAFWQAGGGYDRNIYSRDEYREKIDYIHDNPLRRKLVVKRVDWKWSSAAAYAKVSEGPLVVDDFDLPWT